MIMNSGLSLSAPQQPDWPDPARLHQVTSELADLPPLVTPAECDTLRDRMAAVSRGEAFMLQGGDCAETFATSSAESVAGKVRTLAQMALAISRGTGQRVVTVGRIAGQYGKPRSAPTETRHGLTLPVYRGDAVNGAEFTLPARTPDPHRLLSAYHASADALTRLRDLVGDGEFFTSHEALLLPYEHALTRGHPLTGVRHGTSGHLLWIGERTRQLGGAHVDFAAGIANPVAVKLGPTAAPDDVLALADRLDPDRVPGRLTLIARMGSSRVRDVLPALVEKAVAEGLAPNWVCDPMHGNTITTPTGHKTRLFDDILDEITGFFAVHHALGTVPGGLHLEVTGEDVTECVGGYPMVAVDGVHRRYETVCDPRLNPSQALELAFLVADIVRVRADMGRAG
jgi:3-deoxy-7-phosphoheptulonate synthase